MAQRIRKISLFFFIVFLFFNDPTFSQSWLKMWQQSTISFGVVDSFSVLENNVPTIIKYYKIIGTGCLFYVKVDTQAIPTIVTAKHIFKDVNSNWFPDSINIRFSFDDHKSIFNYWGISIPLKFGSEALWFEHPDPTVDLACLPLINSFGDSSAHLNVIPYKSIAEEIEIFEGANIFVLGYPASIGIQFGNHALLREGIISWISPSDQKNSKVLIDCDVFPGNSGGPVFYVPTGLNIEGNISMGGQIKFIGIVTERRFSENPIKKKNQDVVDQFGNKIFSLESIGIGVIEPAWRVNELLDNTSKYLNSILSDYRKAQNH